MKPAERAALAVFLKYPEPGKVKSRLARDIGDIAASDAYKTLVKRLWETSLVCLPPEKVEIFFFVDPFRPVEDYEALLQNEIIGNPTELSLVAQEGADLGQRLAHCFLTLLNSFSRVLVIGTDCPTISRDIFDSALDTTADVVLGPALDGGYYLIGLSKPQPALFEGVPWSTNEVLIRTLEKIGDLKQTYELLPALADIDCLEDWEKVTPPRTEP